MRRHRGQDSGGPPQGNKKQSYKMTNRPAEPSKAPQKGRNYTFAKYQKEHQQGKKPAPRLPTRSLNQGGVPRRVHFKGVETPSSNRDSAQSKPLHSNANAALSVRHSQREYPPKRRQKSEHEHFLTDNDTGYHNSAASDSLSDDEAPALIRKAARRAQDPVQASSPSYHTKHIRFASEHAPLSHRPQASKAQWYICPYCVNDLPHVAPAYHVASNISVFSTLSQPPSSPTAMTGVPTSFYNGFNAWGIGQIHLPIDHNDGSGCSVIELDDVVYAPDYPVMHADDQPGWYNQRLNTICLLRWEREGMSIGLSKFQGWAWLSVYDDDIDGVVRWIALAEEREHGLWELVLCRREGMHELHEFYSCHGEGNGKVKEGAKSSVDGGHRYKSGSRRPNGETGGGQYRHQGRYGQKRRQLRTVNDRNHR